MMNRVRLWIRSALLRRRHEREMQEEMAQHLERAAERLVLRGLSPSDARRQALREFGNVALLQDQARDARSTGWLDAAVGDVRFAIRHFRRRPLTMLAMLVVLSVGMSISTLLFSYVHSYAVLPPRGIAAQDDLVRIRGSQDAGVYGRSLRGFTEAELQRYQGLTDHFSAVAGWTMAQVALDAGPEVGRRGLEARATFVTENYFAVLGAQPLHGPGLPTTADPVDAAAAVINDPAWTQLFGRSPDVIGRTVSLNGVPVTIAGVAPPDFEGVGGFGRFKFWLPLPAARLLGVQGEEGFRAAGRLRPGVSTTEATAAAQVARAAAVSEWTPEERRRTPDPGTEVVPLLAANGDPMFVRDVKLMTIAVGLLALLVLLVTCTNVSALLTGLATARRQEIAIRLSLGAARARLIRQLLTESVLLASTAAATSLVVLAAVLRGAKALVPLPFEIGITWPATAFTFSVALTVGVLFGLSPALHATRLALAAVLRDSAAAVTVTRARLQRGLVVAQIAFTQPLIVLLAAVLILVMQYQPRDRSALGERVVAMTVRSHAVDASSPADEDATRRQVRSTMLDLRDRVVGTAGVEDAVMDWGGAVPIGSYGGEAGAEAEGVVRSPVPLAAIRVAAGHFDLVGVRLLRGRGFAPDEVAPVVGDAGTAAGEVPVVIGAALAERLWPRADPLGRRLRAASDTAPAARALVVIGVVDDEADRPRAGADHRVYLPPDTTRLTRTLLIRTAGPASLLVPQLRSLALEEAPGATVTARTMADIENEQHRNFRLVAGGISVAGLLALLLAAIGLYAVIAFSVGERTREIAVRIAVGGERRQIAGRFVRDGLRLGAIGLAVGLPVSVLALRVLMSSDPDVPQVSLQPVVAIAALGVIAVAAAAAWLPARRAAAVDPAITLRAE